MKSDETFGVQTRSSKKRNSARHIKEYTTLRYSTKIPNMLSVCQHKIIFILNFYYFITLTTNIGHLSRELLTVEAVWFDCCLVTIVRSFS